MFNSKIANLVFVLFIFFAVAMQGAAESLKDLAQYHDESDPTSMPEFRDLQEAHRLWKEREQVLYDRWNGYIYVNGPWVQHSNHPFLADVQSFFDAGKRFGWARIAEKQSHEARLRSGRVAISDYNRKRDCALRELGLN